MALYHEDIVDIELSSGSVHRSWLNHSIGLGDAAANRFGVRLFRDGSPVTIGTASCQGYFHNAIGQNIALTDVGTIDDNVAYVTLPQACYSYEGQFTLAIKIVGGGVTGTMRIIDGMVDNTNVTATVAPTSSVPTYQEVLATYAEMEEALEDAEGWMDNFAPEFAAGTANTAGSYVTKDGKMYILPAGHEEDATWANTSKTQVNVGGELSELKSALLGTQTNMGVVEDLIRSIEKTGKYSFTFEPYHGYFKTNGEWQNHDSHANAKILYKFPSGLYMYGNPIEEGSELVVGKFSCTDGVFSRVQQYTGGVTTEPDYYYSLDFYKSGGYTSYPTKADCVIYAVDANSITTESLKNGRDAFIESMQDDDINYMAFLPDNDMGTLWDKGYYNSSLNWVDSSYYRTMKNYIPDTIESVSAESGYLINVYFFDSEGTILQRKSSETSFSAFQHDKFKYKIGVQRSPSGSMDGINWTPNITITEKPLYYKSIDKINSDIESIINNGAIDLLENSMFVKGSINSSGTPIDVGYAYRTSDYIPSTIKSIKAKTGKAFMIYMYNSGDVYQGRKQNQFDYVLDHETFKYKIVVYNYPLDTHDDVSEMSPDEFVLMLSKPIQEQHDETCTYSVNNGVITIDIPKARFTLKQVNDLDAQNSIRINTWRLYQGDLKKNGAVIGTMWSNSDVEGAIKLEGESDFIGGFHGDEIMDETTLVILADGIPLDVSETASQVKFDEITLCVKSNLYHQLGTEHQDDVAFERVKTLRFTQTGYTVSNRFKALETLEIDRGALAMIPVKKKDSANNQMINYLGSNSDLILYPCPDDSGGDKPSSKANKPITEGTLYLNGSVLRMTLQYGQDNPGYNAFFNNDGANHRIKIYFDQYNGQTVSANTILQDELTVTII